MLVRKKRRDLLKKKAKSDDGSSDENLQSVRSWIRKIEQSTTSVSSRLSAVEKRLSTGLNETEGTNLIAMNGRVETLLMNVKKKSATAVARVLDGELTLLHNETMDQKKETDDLKEQISAVKEVSITAVAELNALRTELTQMRETMEQRMEQKRNAKPFVMHLGTLEIPIEFSGIIGGLLAFTIAGLVLINQKEILLSPLFLFGVGSLLISSALLKTIRAYSRNSFHRVFPLPPETPSVQIDAPPEEKQDG
jgi:hypothetical protein